MVVIVAAIHHHRGLGWGITLIVLGVAHLVFRSFYARRHKAVHDARQDTATSVGSHFYRRHGYGYYARTEIVFGVVFIVAGAIAVISSA
jgi:FAD/FMN-containing dehydrogenase